MGQCLLLGIEGGATRTVGMLAGSELSILARREGRPANYHAVGEAAARAAVADLVAGLLADAGLEPSHLSASALCMAGLRRPIDHAVWRRIAGALGINAPVLLTHDAASGLAAGSADGTGILVICGTGSLVYGRRRNGREHFVGGWGHVLGDEGSAFDIGQSGLRAAIRSAEGRGPRTVLEQFIPQRLGLEGLQDLVAWTSPFAKDRVAGVAPVVFEAAADGDEVSQLILRTAADELGRGIALVVDRLWPREEGGDRLERVVFSGGVLRNQPTFREELARRARAVAPSAACILPEVEGALGAVRLARRWLDESRI